MAGVRENTRTDGTRHIAKGQPSITTVQEEEARVDRVKMETHPEQVERPNPDKKKRGRRKYQIQSCKIKVAAVIAMKACGGVEVWFCLFLTSSLVKVSGQLYAAAASPQGRNRRRPLNTSLWAPEPVWTLAFSGNQPRLLRCQSVRSLVTTRTDLPRSRGCVWTDLCGSGCSRPHDHVLNLELP